MMHIARWRKLGRHLVANKRLCYPVQLLRRKAIPTFHRCNCTCAECLNDAEIKRIERINAQLVPDELKLVKNELNAIRRMAEEAAASGDLNKLTMLRNELARANHYTSLAHNPKR